ncbi:hypothetical protein ACFLUZ_00060 [Chloroflexota bacterium]
MKKWSAFLAWFGVIIIISFVVALAALHVLFLAGGMVSLEMGGYLIWMWLLSILGMFLVLLGGRRRKQGKLWYVLIATGVIYSIFIALTLIDMRVFDLDLFYAYIYWLILSLPGIVCIVEGIVIRRGFRI